MKFTYASGQRPLDGYTLKRGVGRGGFGEVYYAVSDGGKEVALKLLRGNEVEIELRGVAQCINIKHPNLVSLFDLKTDAQGDHWVVMEYIAGETLSLVLSRHPDGLAPDLAQQWFIALARAVGHLHEHGIVHRDLKPGNVFLENGVLKVGDYGLSKFISNTRYTAQTQSVGTVHYMAPEIAKGNYNRQIDIYAAGIMLYEMLTGRVPFEGESAGEILMKHLTAPPDLTRLPIDFRPIVGKALAKDPAQRFGSMADMIHAVEAIGRSEERKAFAGRVDPASEPLPQAQRVPPQKVLPPEPVLNVLPAPSFRQLATELCGSLSLTALFAVLSTAVVAALARTMEWNRLGSIFFLTVAVCWAVLIVSKFWLSRPADGWLRRASMMVAGVLIGAGALWLEGWSATAVVDETVSTASSSGSHRGLFPANGVSLVAGYLSYFGLALFLMRWWKLTDRNRREWFGLGPIMLATFWGAILLIIAPYMFHTGFVALIASSIILQLATPWEPPPPRPARPVRMRYA